MQILLDKILHVITLQDRTQSLMATNSMGNVSMPAHLQTFGANEDVLKAARLRRAHAIIHGAAISAAGVAASFAQTPGADSAMLSAITANMVFSICRVYGVSQHSKYCTSLVACAVGNHFGADMATKLVSWIPGVGNAANAIVTFSLHETTGWAIVALLEEQRANGELDHNARVQKELLKRYSEKGKQYKSANSSNPAFAGCLSEKEERINLAKKAINDFMIKYNTKDLQENKGEIAQKLTDTLCKLHNLDKNNPNYNNIKNMFITNTELINLTNTTPDKDTKELLFDKSYEATFWTLFSILEKAVEREQNLNEPLDFNKKALKSNSLDGLRYALSK